MEEPTDYCEQPCHGPVIGYNRWQRAFHWFCWLLIVKIIPNRWTLSKPSFVILPYAGNHAHACICADKNDAMLTARREQADG
jgi:hypothetical protein